MAQYNHFAKTKYKGVQFSDLKVGDYFGKDGNTFSTHIKMGELKYLVRRTKESITLFGTNFIVYIKLDNTV